ALGNVVRPRAVIRPTRRRPEKAVRGWAIPFHLRQRLRSIAQRGKRAWVDRSKGPVPEPHMRKNHLYVLGINAYDHDVSACLLRDGEIAFAINKERITREQHDTGFYQEVVDYCLSAESISLDDVDLVVRNCYVLPVEDLETRMVSQDVPEVMDDGERRQASKNPLFLSRSNKVITISHHLAHAYSAFAVSPFHEGAVMVVDGVGNYASDVAD